MGTNVKSVSYDEARLIAMSGGTNKEAAEHHGVHKSIVSRIRLGEYYEGLSMHGEDPPPETVIKPKPFLTLESFTNTCLRCHRRYQSGQECRCGGSVK